MVYKKGQIRFERDSSGVLQRVGKPKKSISIGVSKTKTGRAKVVKPTSTTKVKRGNQTLTQSTYNVGGKNIISTNGRVNIIQDKRSGLVTRISRPPPPPPSRRLTYLDVNKQSVDPNKLRVRTTKSIQDSKGRVWGYVDYKENQTVGFSRPITKQQLFALEQKRQPVKLVPKVVGRGKVKPLGKGDRLTSVKFSDVQFKKLARTNLQAGLPNVTPSIVSKVIIPKNVNFGVSVVIPPKYLEVTNYKGLGKVAQKFASKGFVVPAEVVFGIQAGFKDWKSALIGFVAGAGIQSISALSSKSAGSKMKALGKTVGKVAASATVVFLLYDLGKEYNRLVVEGNSKSFALSKAITTFGTTVGGGAVGASAAKVATSSATRKAISVAAKKSVANINKPTKATYKNIISFLESANPVRPYKEIVLSPSGLKGSRIVKRVDPVTKREIRTIVSKLESIIKFGNAHVTVIKKAPVVTRSVRVSPTVRVKPLPKDLSLVPINQVQSTNIIAKRYLVAYKNMLRVSTPKAKKFSTAQVKAFEKELRSIQRQVAQAKKLKAGLQVKQRPLPKTKIGTTPVYQFKELVSGKTLTFKSRVKFLKAVKEQEKLIRSGKIVVSKPKVTKWLNIINKNQVKPIYPKPKISSKEKQAFINNLLRESAKQRKLKAGLQVKAPRSNIKTSRGYYYRNLVTGKDAYAPTRKQWLKAIKIQQKLVNTGKSKESAKTVKEFFNLANKELTSKDGVKLAVTVTKKPSVAQAKFKKRIFTLQDVAKKTTVKKTSSGGVEVKAVNGQVVVLETPKTITKNKAAVKQLQKVAQSQRSVSKLKVGTKQVFIIKPTILNAVKSYGLTISQATKIGSAIARVFSSKSASKFKQTSLQAKIIEPIFKKGVVSKFAYSQAQAQVQFKIQAQKRVSRSIASSVQKAKGVYGGRTVNKLLTIKDFSIRRKKTKYSKDEIKYMLSKVYVKGKYKPSLAALVFNITGFKAPKKLTGFEIRPIIKKRK